MRLTPSGTRKISKYAQYRNEDLEPRFDIQQEPLGVADAEPRSPLYKNDSNYNPIGDLQKNLDQEMGRNNRVPPSKFDTMQNEISSENTPSSNNQNIAGGSIKIKQFIDQKLVELGVPERKLIEHEKRRFQYNKKKQSGFFEVPERTGNGDFITEDQVDNICTEIEEQFGLDTDWNFAGGIFKVEFMPKKMETQKGELSSWDSSKTAEKSALSRNSIIKNNQSHIIDVLISKGFGGKNVT